jgi:hypothetical protein
LGVFTGVWCIELLSTCPISRTPPLMRDRKDSDFIGRDLIEKTIGKPGEYIPAPGYTEDCANIGVHQYSTCSPLELGEEREAKLGVRGCSIKGGSIVQLVKRKWNNDQPHFKAARTLARASAIGIT